MRLNSDKIIQPMVTEKSAQQEAKFNEYALVVDPKMTKLEIKKAVEDLFGVKPVGVRTINFRKKAKRNRYAVVAPKSYKKALVRLPEGKRLELK